MTIEETKAIAIRSLEVVGEGTREDFEEVFHPDYYDHDAEAPGMPPEGAGRGPGPVWAAAQWLRTAFADIGHDIRQVVVQDDLVVIYCIGSGRHAGEMPLYDAQGAVTQILPPTGKSFSTTQTHWCRIKDGKCVEHWANRDDLGMSRQLGWLPAG